MNIAITGLGIICAIGNNSQQVLDSLVNRKTGVGMMKYLQSCHTELPVGEVKLSDDELKTLLSLPVESLYSRTTLLGAVAVKQAMADAGLSADMLAGKKVVLISGTTVGGMDVTERILADMREVLQTPNANRSTPIDYVKRHDCGSTTNEIAQICGLDCEVCTISTACSSAINSIIVGCEMLRSGEADLVIAGGSEALSKFHLNGFNTLHILDTEVCRPFDATRVGLNLGEGAAFVVLQKDKADGKAYIGGYGNKCDAFHQTASSDDGEGAYLAMREALESSGIDKSQIDYINAHGTGTPNNDPSESVALKRIFGDDMPLVSSTKGFTGHTTSASGSIETVICVLAMQNNFVPVSYGFSLVDEACIHPFEGDDKQHRMDYVICNSFGFGGNDSSLLLMREAKDCSMASAKIPELEIAADITIDSMEQLADYKEYISPKEGRRMGKLMKAATLTSLMALREAGIECPDAIITATANGMLETSEKFLVDMVDNGEETLSPTLFMQSTHNTIGSAIAIRTQCHGYNITYTQGKDSMKWALRDAERLIRMGKAKTVLVGCHDESSPLFKSFYEYLNFSIPQIYSRSVLLKAK
ncbi:MAG: beta-ketoacyl-[Prevotella sp.]|nr:beta-ketoacyl-[acyl-carrier-protein] synthase family protein [Prevotella sp.]